MKRLLPLLTAGGLLLLTASVLAQDPNDLQAGDPQTRELMEQGSKFFITGDYKRAIPPYQKALDREKADRTLSLTLWRVLVDKPWHGLRHIRQLEEGKRDL